MKKVSPLLILIPFLLMSCATLSNMFPAPETPEENILYAKMVIIAANHSVIDLLNAGLMTSTQAKEYRTQKDRAQDMLILYQLYLNQDKLVSAHDQWRLLEIILGELQKNYVLKGVNINDTDGIGDGSIIVE